MLLDAAARIEQCKTLDDLWSALLEALPVLGFDFVCYLSVSNDFEDAFARTNIPDLFTVIPPREDPFIIHCCKSYEIFPVGTAFVHRYNDITDRDRAFIENAARQGFTAGLAIPMRLKGNSRFGGFILGNGMDMVQFSKKMLPRAEEFRLFCMIIHRRIEELVEAPQEPVTAAERAALVSHALPEAFDALTPRESEVIVLLSQGKTRAETARICNISVHTVSDYAKHGYRKLGIHNRAEAAALMLSPDLRV